MRGKRHSSLQFSATAQHAQPNDGCDTYKHKAPYTDTVYFIAEGGNCPLSTKIHYAQKANAHAVVLLHSDNDLSEIIEIEEFPGVNIPIMMVGRKEGLMMSDMLTEQRNSKVVLNFQFSVPKTDEIFLDFWYSPDSYKALKFLTHFNNKDHGYDLGTKLTLRPHFVLWHCDTCEDKSYKEQKSGCYSGGRYCTLSLVNNDTKKAEMVLNETLRQICLNNLLDSGDSFPDKNDVRQIKHYYYKHQKDNCFDNVDNNPDCVYDYFEKQDQIFRNNKEAFQIEQDVKKKVTNCMNNSFVKSFPDADKVNPQLDDNLLMKEELAKFQKNSAYEQYPLLKINGVNYNGSLHMYDIKQYLCIEVMRGTRCNYGHGVIGTLFEYWLLFAIVILIMIFFCLSMVICKKRLTERYETELNLKIDQSISQFLDKS